MTNRIPRFLRPDALPRRRFLAGGVAAVAVAATVSAAAFAQSATPTAPDSGARPRPALVPRDQQAFLSAFAPKSWA
jgi:hypothetical protein